MADRARLFLVQVVNHVASTDGSSFKPGAEHGAFDTAGDYHTYCTISDYTNQNQVEQCWLGDNNVILPDIDTEDDTVVSYYEAWIKQLVSDYSCVVLFRLAAQST